MRNGGVIAYAAPEDLLRSVGGNVWEMVVRSDEFDELRRTARVSGAVRKSDGVHVRLVSSDQPRGGVAAEPTLEDAFLYAMSTAA